MGHPVFWFYSTSKLVAWDFWPSQLPSKLFMKRLKICLNIKRYSKLHRQAVSKGIIKLNCWCRFCAAFQPTAACSIILHFVASLVFLSESCKGSSPRTRNTSRFSAISDGSPGSAPAMSNRNGLLSQILCHYLNQGRTLNDILMRAAHWIA